MSNPYQEAIDDLTTAQSGLETAIVTATAPVAAAKAAVATAAATLASAQAALDALQGPIIHAHNALNYNRREIQRLQTELSFKIRTGVIVE
jgi:chromosome segregation ATPase